MLKKRKLYSLIAKLMIIVMLIPLCCFSSITTLRVSAAPNATGNNPSATGNNPTATGNNSVVMRWTDMVKSGSTYIQNVSMTLSGSYSGIAHPRYSGFNIESGTAIWIYRDYYAEGEDLVCIVWDDVSFSNYNHCTLSFDNTPLGYYTFANVNQPSDNTFENMPNSITNVSAGINGSNITMDFAPTAEGTVYGYFKASRVEKFQWQSVIPYEGGYTPAMLQPLELTYVGNGHPIYSEGYGPATLIYFSNYFDNNTDLLYFQFDDSRSQPTEAESQFSVRFKNVYGHTSIEEYSGSIPAGTSVPTATAVSESIDNGWINLVMKPNNNGRNYIFYKAKRGASVSGVTLNKTQTSMWPDTSEKLVATVRPEDAVNKEVIWNTTNEYIASVNEEGLVVAKHPGIVKVTATTRSGGYSASCNVTVQAEMPELSIQCSVDGVILDWEEQDVTSYRIYRKAGSGTWEKLNDVWGTGYIDHNVISSTKYSYYIMCLDDESYEEISPYNKNKVKTVSYYRLNPPKLTVTQVSGGINVSWEAMQDVEKYRVFRKTASGNWTSIKYTTGLSYKDTNVEGDTSYTYGVICLNPDGKYLNELVEGGSIVFKNYTPAITLKSDNSGVQISWNAIDEAAKYRVYRKTASGNWTALKTTTGLSYTDTGVEHGNEYIYGIISLRSNGSYLNKLEEGGRILYEKNFRPDLELSQDNSGVQIGWNAIDEAAKYRVYRKTASGNWTALKTTTGLSYTDTAVENGTEYIYGIISLRSNGSYLNKLEEGGRILYEKNYRPTLTIAKDNSGVRISWDAIDEAAKYRIYRKTEGGAWVRFAPTKGLSYLDTDVESGTEYIYGIISFDANGAALNKLVEGGRILYEKTYRPTLTIAKDNSGVRISWDAIDEAAKYRIYRKTEGGAWVRFAPTKGLSYLDTDVESGTEYIYGIISFDANGAALNKLVEGGRILYEKTYRPTLTIAKDNSGVRISWDAIDEAAKYRIYRKTEGGAWVRFAPTKGLSYLDTDVESGTEYIYGIISFDANGVALNKLVEGGRIRYIK